MAAGEIVPRSPTFASDDTGPDDPLRRRVRKYERDVARGIDYRPGPGMALSNRSGSSRQLVRHQRSNTSVKNMERTEWCNRLEAQWHPTQAATRPKIMKEYRMRHYQLWLNRMRYSKRYFGLTSPVHEKIVANMEKSRQLREGE